MPDNKPRWHAWVKDGMHGYWRIIGDADSPDAATSIMLDYQGGSHTEKVVLPEGEDPGIRKKKRK